MNLNQRLHQGSHLPVWNYSACSMHVQSFDLPLHHWDWKLVSAYTLQFPFGSCWFYCINLQDDNEYPIEGLYLNAKYSFSKVKDKVVDLPYKLGNDYRTDLISSGTYIESYFANIIAFSESSPFKASE